MIINSWWRLLTLPEHMSSPTLYSVVRVTRSLVLYVCFVDRCLSFCTFSFWPLCCLFFFDIRILIASLVSSNSYFHFRVIEALCRNDVTQRTIFEWKIFSRIFSRFSFEAIVQFYQEKHVIFIEILFVLEQLA
jgi:hypothetical protein